MKHYSGVKLHACYLGKLHDPAPCTVFKIEKKEKIDVAEIKGPVERNVQTH